ncbi:unnamed protein product [Gordionus sp. m RMFG-2023]
MVGQLRSQQNQPQEGAPSQPPPNLLMPDNSLNLPTDGTTAIALAIQQISQQMETMSTRMLNLETSGRRRSPSARSNYTSTPFLDQISRRSRPPSPTPVPAIKAPLTPEERVAKLTRVWTGVSTDLLEPRCKASERDRHELKHLKEVVDLISVNTEPGIIDSITRRVPILGLAIHWGWDTARLNDTSYQEKFLDSEEIKLAKEPFRSRGRAGPSTTY